MIILIVKETFDKRFDQLSLKMDEYVESRKLPCILTLVYHIDNIIDCRIHGYKDFDKKISLEINSIFRIASMTKPIISLAILILFEQGKISLDDKLSKFIPNTENMKVFVKKTENNLILDNLKQEITILDLLTHTSGFVYSSEYNNPVDKKYMEIFRCEFLGYDKNKELMSLDEFAKLIPEVYLKHQPGMEFTYGISTDILGYIIEQVSGQKLDEFLNDQIFSKLDMNETGFFVEEKKLSRLVAIHSQTDQNTFTTSDDILQRSYRDKTNFLSGGAGLTSTISDYLKFAIMLLNKGKNDGEYIIKEETFDLMITDFTTSRGISFSSWDRSGFTDEYRKSLDPYKRDTGFCLGLKKKISNIYYKKGIYGWLGIYGTYFWFDPENKVIGIILSQIMPQQSNFVMNIINSEFEDFVYSTL